MKQIKLVFGRGGRCRILAHGTFGQGTSQLTLKLASDLGEVVERHAGVHHEHQETPVSSSVHA